MVEFREYEGNRYHLTDLGKRFVASITPEPVADALADEDSSYCPPSDWALELSLNAFESRTNKNIGFLVGGTAGFLGANQKLLEFIDGSAQDEDISDFLNREFELGPSSCAAALSTLARLGLIERSGVNTYKVSRLGENWLESPTGINFACCCHATSICFFELLDMLLEENGLGI